MLSPNKVLRSPSIGALAVSNDQFTDVDLDAHRNIRQGHADHSLPSAEEVRMSNGIHGVTKNKRNVLLLGILAAIALLLVVVVPASVSRRRNNTNAQQQQVNVSTSQSSRFPETIAYLLGYVDYLSLGKPGSPQFRAAQWMADNDPLKLTLDHDEAERFLQRFALVVLYYATQGESSWTHQLKFLTYNHECDWNMDFASEDGDVKTRGVLCDDNNVVKQLVIDDLGLSGTLPAELSLLSTMTRLALPRNNLHGSLPDTMADMKELRDLILDHNAFSQQLAEWIGTLVNLEQLALSNNNFYGPLPAYMELLEELTFLSLDKNAFTGSLEVLDLMQQLQELYLQDNQFTGTVDEHWLTTLIELRILDASDNLLQGSVPSALLSLQKLEVLDLHNNGLSGEIQAETQENSSLRFFSVYNNRITGNIPETIANFRNLKHLDVSYNHIEGPIPITLGALTELTYLFLSENAFLDQAPVPQWIHGLTSLRELSLCNTQLVGSLPKWLDDLSQLELLDVGSNQLTGSIPATLGYVSSLRFLLLNRNRLNGTLPDELSQLVSSELLMVDTAAEVCNLNLDIFTADCLRPEVVCTRCSECCEDANRDCNSGNALTNYEASLENGYSRESYELSPAKFVPAN